MNTSNTTAQIAGLLAGARIQARGGRALSEAELDLCAIEALLLERSLSNVSNGAGLPHVFNPRVEDVRARVQAQHSAENLEAQLPRSLHEGAHTTRL